MEGDQTKRFVELMRSEDKCGSTFPLQTNVGLQILSRQEVPQNTILSRHWENGLLSQLVERRSMPPSQLGELEKKEAEIIDKEKKFIEKEKDLESRLKALEEREKFMKVDKKKLENEREKIEKEWKELDEKRIKLKELEEVTKQKEKLEKLKIEALQVVAKDSFAASVQHEKAVMTTHDFQLQQSELETMQEMQKRLEKLEQETDKFNIMWDRNKKNDILGEGLDENRGNIDELVGLNRKLMVQQEQFLKERKHFILFIKKLYKTFGEIICEFEQNGNCEDPAYVDMEGWGEATLLDKGKPKDAQKRNHACISQNTVREQDGDYSEGHSDSITMHGHKRQKIVRVLQNPSEIQRNIGQHKIPVMVAANGALSNLSKGKDRDDDDDGRGRGNKISNSKPVAALSTEVASENGGSMQLVQFKTTEEEDSLEGTWDNADDEEESEHPAKISIGKKLWTFLIT